MDRPCEAASSEPENTPPIQARPSDTVSGVRLAAATLALIASFVAGAAPAVAQPTGDGSGHGFHGYPWGTSPETIPLLAAADSADRPAEGVHTYGATLRFLGMPTRAVFYFDSGGGGLVGGKYLSVPPDLSCVAQFRTLRLLVGSDVGQASLELGEGSGAGAPTARAACRRFLEAPAAEPWEATFVGPARSDTVALVRLLRRAGEPGLLACVRILSDCRWPDEAGIPEGPVLGPARRDTAGAQSE